MQNRNFGGQIRGSVDMRVPQSSILGPSLFYIYRDIMSVMPVHVTQLYLPVELNNTVHLDTLSDI